MSKFAAHSAWSALPLVDEFLVSSDCGIYPEQILYAIINTMKNSILYSLDTRKT